MDRSAHSLSITVQSDFVQFLEGSSFARRTCESYAEDLKPLLTQVGQAPITALTDDIARSFLATQESLSPATYNRRLAALRSFSGFLVSRGWLTEILLVGVERKPEGRVEARALDAQRVE